MNIVLCMFLVSCWGLVTVAALSSNKIPQGKELYSKADGALPILHIVFDTASEEDGAQTLSGATRSILSKLQNAAQNFENETMMSVSTFSGSDSGDGNYLKVLSPPINVIENSQDLYDIIKNEVPASVINDTTRDPGAAIRDALSFSSQLNSGSGDILYLVSRRYVDGGSTVKEIDMIDTLLGSNTTLICVEGSSDDTNGTFNLNRIARLSEGYHFTNTGTISWQNINGQAANKLVELSKESINSVRRTIGRTEYFGVSDVAQIGSFVVSSDLGINSVIIIQSSQKGIVTVTLTCIETEATENYTTQGGTNWNMINANLYVDDLALPSGDSRGRWTYALTFEPDADALDTKSDVVILGLSSENTNPLDYLPFVWASNCNLDFPDQNSTIIYADVIGLVDVLTGLSVTVTLKNIDDISSEDVTIKLTEEIHGMGLYSGIFNPPSNGVYDFFAEFTADTDSVCTGDLCAPSDFSESAPGRCQIVFQEKGIGTTTTDDSTKNPTEDSSSDYSTISTNNMMTEDSIGTSTVQQTDDISYDSTDTPTDNTPTERPTANSTDGQTSNTTDEPTDFPMLTDKPTDSQSNGQTSVLVEKSTSRPTVDPTEEPGVPTGSPAVKQTPNAGFIVGLCLGIGFLIAFLMILLYCCLIVQKDEEKGSSVQEIVSTPPRRSFVQRWRLRLIPAAVLRKPPPVTSSSLSTANMPYKTMYDEMTNTPSPYRRNDSFLFY